MVDRLDTDKLGTPDIQLGGLKIWIHGFQHYQLSDFQLPERPGILSSSFDDDTWLDITVYCEPIPTSVTADANGAFIQFRRHCLRTDELSDWLVQCVQLSQTLVGKAELGCMEPCLSVRISVDEKGQIGAVVCPGFIEYATNDDSFCFKLEQSDLSNLVRDLRKVLEKYPDIGRSY